MKPIRIAAAVTAVLVLGSCGGRGSSGPVVVAVSEQDFSIAATPPTVVEGEITFRITNRGPSVHEFLVVGGFHSVDSLPVKDGVLNEDAEGLIIRVEREAIQPGATVTVRADLTAGDYALVCNLPGHYGRGMRAKLTVEFR